MRRSGAGSKKTGKASERRIGEGGGIWSAWGSDPDLMELMLSQIQNQKTFNTHVRKSMADMDQHVGTFSVADGEWETDEHVVVCMYVGNLRGDVTPVSCGDYRILWIAVHLGKLIDVKESIVVM